MRKGFPPRILKMQKFARLQQLKFRNGQYGALDCRSMLRQEERFIGQEGE